MNFSLQNRVWFTTSTTGNGLTIAVGSGLPGYATLSAAQVPDGSSIGYSIEEGTNYETGTGTYHAAAGGTLDRTTVESSSAGGTTRITLAGNATCFLTMTAAMLGTNSMAFEQSDNVAITDGTAILSTLSVKNGMTETSTADQRNPGGIAAAWSDQTGAICGAVAIDGSWRFGTARILGGTITGLTQLGASNVALSGGTITGLSHLDTSDIAIGGGTATLMTLTIQNGMTETTESRNPNAAQVWADATGAISGVIGIDGSWRLQTATINALTTSSFTTTTLNVLGGGNLAADTLIVNNAASLGVHYRNPGIAHAWADPTNAVAGLIMADGSWRFGNVAAANLSVSGTFTVAAFAPNAISIGPNALAVSDPRNRYAEAKTDSMDNASWVATNTGSVAFTPASGVLAKHLQSSIERSHMMSQGPPSHSDSASTAGVSGTTYHLTATLDSAGFDAVRLVIISMRTPAGATLSGCIATSANATDPINPKDAGGTAQEWRPVTWGSNGAATNWEDQPEGTLRLLTSAITTVGSNVLTFADTTGVVVGMVVSIPAYNSSTGMQLANHFATVTAVTSTTVTLSKNVQNIQVISGWPVFFTTSTFVLPAWGGSASGVMGNLYVSDWIGLSSLDRSDGGRWPILMARVYATGGAHTTLVTDLSQTNWNGAARDRLWNCYTQAGNFVANPAGFTSTTDNGTMIVGWLQYYSRSRGCSVLFAGDSITQGINGTIDGLGGLQVAAYQLSTPSCPVTNFGMVNGWNNAGVGEYIWTTVLQHVDVFQPNVLAMCAWTRNGEFNKPPSGHPAYAQETADWYWQQSLRIATKARRKYRTQTILYPMGPSDATEFTATTELVRVSALKRSQQANLSGVMYLDSDALLGTGSTPVNDTNYPGLHPPPSGQVVLGLDVARQYKTALGIA